MAVATVVSCLVLVPLEPLAATTFHGGCLDTCYLDGNTSSTVDLATSNYTVTGPHTSITFKGWVGFNCQMSAIGYKIDDGEPVFNASFFTNNEEAAVKDNGNGGTYGKRFTVTVPVTGLFGTHTIVCVVRLSEDNSVVELTGTGITPNTAVTYNNPFRQVTYRDAFEVGGTAVASSITEQPELETLRDYAGSSVTLRGWHANNKNLVGFGYRVNGGAVTYRDSYKVATDSAVLNAAGENVGTNQHTSRFSITLTVPLNTVTIEVIVNTGSEELVIWTLRDTSAPDEDESEEETDAGSGGPSQLDESEGSLVYTDNGNGTVTISYRSGNDTLSYTVPDNAFYTSGPLSATDDLGRSTYTADDAEAGELGFRGEKYVGLFYYLVRDTNIDPITGKLRNIVNITTEILSNNNTTLPYNGVAVYAEPLYGYYTSNDEWVIRKNIEMFTLAGVDFLYFDTTNCEPYVDNALAVMRVCHEFNARGFDAPQVVFYTRADTANGDTLFVELNTIYNDIYEAHGPGTSEDLSDTWFRLNGKPVIVAPYLYDSNGNVKIMRYSRRVNDDNGSPALLVEQYIDDARNDTVIENFFTVKRTVWPNEDNETGDYYKNGWPWVDYTWPQTVYPGIGADGQPDGMDAISVSAAQHSGNVMFSTGSLNNYYYNRGKSFDYDGEYMSVTGHPFTWSAMSFTPADASYRAACEEAWTKAHVYTSETDKGNNFGAQFERAIESDATFILVTQWNELLCSGVSTSEDNSSTYALRLGSNPRQYGSYVHIDAFSPEYSRDIEPLKGLYFDNYYMQLVENIQRIKGVAPTVVQDDRHAIDVAGSFSQWDTVKVTYRDPANDMSNRSCRGIGNVTYTSSSGVNDIVASKITSDTKNLYFYAETSGNVSTPDYNSNAGWMQLFIDIDCDSSTGWYGYDYVVNYHAQNGTTTTVARYTGTDGAYGFTALADTVSYKKSGNKLMISVPQSMLGIDAGHYMEICFRFKWADSNTVFNTMEKFYTDGDAAPLGRLNFVYQKYVPGTTPTYPDPIPTDDSGRELRVLQKSADVSTVVWAAPVTTKRAELSDAGADVELIESDNLMEVTAPYIWLEGLAVVSKRITCFGYRVGEQIYGRENTLRDVWIEDKNTCVGTPTPTYTSESYAYITGTDGEATFFSVRVPVESLEGNQFVTAIAKLSDDTVVELLRTVYTVAELPTVTNGKLYGSFEYLNTGWMYDGASLSNGQNQTVSVEFTTSTSFSAISAVLYGTNMSCTVTLRNMDDADDTPTIIEYSQSVSKLADIDLGGSYAAGHYQITFNFLSGTGEIGLGSADAPGGVRYANVTCTGNMITSGKTGGAPAVGIS